MKRPSVFLDLQDAEPQEDEEVVRRLNFFELLQLFCIVFCLVFAFWWIGYLMIFGTGNVTSAINNADVTWN